MSIATAYGVSTGHAELAKKRFEEIQKAETLAGNPPIPQQLPELELSAQNKIDWLTHPRTQEMFKQLGEEVKKLYELATEIANATLHEINIRAVEQALVRARTLQEVIRIYSKH